MSRFSLELPALYADHHVLEVRRVLNELPGVQSVYASSGFKVVEVDYDPDVLSPDAIETALGEAGYLGKLTATEERQATPFGAEGEKPFYRRSIVQQGTGSSVSFAQVVPSSGQSLWPCPGMGVLRNGSEEAEDG